MNVIVEIESAHAEDIARRFHQSEPEGKKNWILKNKGILVGKQVHMQLLSSVVCMILKTDENAVIRIVKQ
jgi:hypothetical protein